MKKIFLLCAIAVLLPVSMFSASYYDTGSHLFSFRLGTSIPTFTYFMQDNDWKFGPGEGKTGMNLGGYGAISYQIFNSPTTAIGGEIGYNFNYSAEDEFFSAVPFFAKYSFYPVQGVIDLPISFGLGGAYNKYNDATFLSLYANVEIGITWYPGENWGFGITTGMWIIPEFNYREDLKPDNAIAGFIPITLSVTYRQ